MPRKAGFDCILVPLGDGIDARYMTQLRCSAMVLPTDGRAPIIIADRRSSNEWVPDPWQTGREWAEPMGEALLDLGMERARIGVAGLKGGVGHPLQLHRRRGQSHGSGELMSKVPNATFRRRHGCGRLGSLREERGRNSISFAVRRRSRQPGSMN